ncbi:MAG: 2-polyprenylphenol 6-hydroxylase, partial [Sphingopyxis sp.]
MTRPATHILRLLRWGRILARHGALRALEQAPTTPAPVRRLARIARFGTIQPATPDYAAAFRAIGPAAIKLGQTLATRPDLIGEDSAANLLCLQDALPPMVFAAVRPHIEQSLGRPIDQLFSHFDETPVGSASIAQVYRATTVDGADVAVKVLRPGVREKLARDIQTYEWAAAHLEHMGAEAARLRPRLVIANFKRWTQNELDFRREAASASEIGEAAQAISGYTVPAIDWDRTTGSVMTMQWVDGIKIVDRDALIRAGIDLKLLANRLVLAFLQQAIGDGFFHADMHHGNLLVSADGTITAIDFGITGRINRQARVWLAEILYGLITGNYRRVAEIHFEAQYVPSHHNLDEFATALRAVGEPMRGKAAKDMSVGLMLDSLFAITRDFDMETQPHLLLLQKTMVMVEGVATGLDPDLNMWDTAGPFVQEWIRSELGPEAIVADRLIETSRTISRLPDLIRRIERAFPAPGGAPPPPPLPDIALMWDRPATRHGGRGGGGWARAMVAGAMGAAAAATGLLWWLGW